jgi:hypothetical protein
MTGDVEPGVHLTQMTRRGEQQQQDADATPTA